MRIVINMNEYDFTKDAYEELFNKISSIKRNIKAAENITIYFSSD